MTYQMNSIEQTRVEMMAATGKRDRLEGTGETG